MAWSSVHSRSLALASSRDRMPVTTTTIRTTPASIPKMPNLRRETGGRCSVGMRSLQFGVGDDAVFPVYHTKNHRNEHQRRRRRKYQTADHGASERRVLLAALPTAERHWHPANDHGEPAHQHR